MNADPGAAAPPDDRSPPGAAPARRRRRRLAVPAIVAAVLALAWFEQTVWLRPLIQHHVRERSGRQVDFDAIRVGVNGALQPTVRFRNLRIDNAPWAAARPMVRAREIDLTFSWSTLGRGRIVIIDRMHLVDAELDLELHADGRRNWRLTDPENRGPGRVRVQSLDANRTRARFVHHGQNLELNLATSPLASPEVIAGQANLPLNKSLAFDGAHNGTAFHGVANVSNDLTFYDTGRAFALRGVFETAHSASTVAGTFRDLLQFAAFDGDVHVVGTGVAELFAVAGSAAVAMPALATDADAHVRKQGREWTIAPWRARFGRSELGGTAEFRQKDAAGAEALLRARVAGTRVDLQPWSAGRRADAAPFDRERFAAQLKGLDAEVELAIERVDGVPLGPLGALRATASAKDGRVTLAAHDAAFAGGHVAGTLMLDVTRAPAEASLDLKLKGLRLARLLDRPAAREALSGELISHVVLRARGDSLQALTAALGGTIQAELANASIPDPLEAKLGLDGGRWLRSFFTPHARAPITCSALVLAFDAGKGRVRQLALETDAVALTGAGDVDLVQRRFDLVLTPRRKQFALVALDRSLHVKGSAAGTDVTLLDRGPDAAVPAGCGYKSAPLHRTTP